MPAFSIGKAAKGIEFGNSLGKEVKTTPMITPGPGTYAAALKKFTLPTWR